MLKGKKGSDAFSVLMVILSFYLIGHTIFVFSTQGMDDLGFVVGKAQSEFIGKVKEGEKELFYIDEAVRLAANKALVEMGQKGGLYDRNCIGSGAYSWDRCEVNVEDSFVHYFKPLFENFIRKEFSDIKYSYKLENNVIKGISSDYLEFGRVHEEGIWGYRQEVDEEEGLKYDVGIDYKVKPDFSYNTEFEFGVYDKIREDLKKNKECKEVTCGHIGDVFEVKTGHKVLVDGKIEEVIIKLEVKDFDNL